jgi:hypothetical protein
MTTIGAAAHAALDAVREDTVRCEVVPAFSASLNEACDFLMLLCRGAVCRLEAPDRGM